MSTARHVHDCINTDNGKEFLAQAFEGAHVGYWSKWRDPSFSHGVFSGRPEEGGKNPNNLDASSAVLTLDAGQHHFLLFELIS